MDQKASMSDQEKLDKVRVDHYGAPTPLHEVATITYSEPRTITIMPWEPNSASAILEALREAGFTASEEGGIIRLPIQPTTATAS
ncbi:ribosome-recycling factor [Streptomyces sp. NPDC048489]|uniref:ribosome-recycling factor n=1 Tax=Streptomyces sp. NPDC048489 TaxID=3154504 RepID=UPI003439414B